MWEAIDISKWKNIPYISGRPATEEDIENGIAVFAVSPLALFKIIKENYMIVKTMPLIIIFVILFGFRSISMAEEYPKNGDVGLSIDSSSRLILKKMVSDNYALSLGMLLGSSYYSSDDNSRSSSFLVGCRNYREKGNYNYFIDLDFVFSHYHDEDPYSSYWSQSYSLRAYYGLEHFINKQLSLGGRAGILANYYESKNGSGSTRIQLPIADIALTYYW